jgi:rhomboid protease GluP
MLSHKLPYAGFLLGMLFIGGVYGCGIGINFVSRPTTSKMPVLNSTLLQGVFASCESVLHLCREYPVSSGIFAVNALVYAAQLYYRKFKGRDLIQQFGGQKSAIQRGQRWRLLTGMFLHINHWHWVVNNANLILQSSLEKTWGSRRFFSLYMASGLLAGITSYVFHRDPLYCSVGASGALYGITGANIASNNSGHNDLKDLVSEVGSEVLLNTLRLFSGCIDRVDHAAHVGGLLSGYVLGKILAH